MKAIRVWYAVDREGYFYTGAPYRDVDSEMFDYLKDISEFGHENPHN